VKDATPVDVRAELELLARQYRSNLGSELAQLKAQAAALSDSEPPSMELLQAVHRLAGSSLSFGYHALGGQLQQIEAWIDGARAQVRAAPDALAAVASLQLAAETVEAAEDVIAAELAIAPKPPPHPTNAGPKLQVGSNPPRALLLDRFGWISPEIELVIEAYGFDTRRIEAEHASEDADLLIECTLTPWAEPPAITHSTLFLVCACEGFEQRLAAVRRGARAFLPHPIDITHLERRLQALVDERAHRPFRAVLLDDDAPVLQLYRLALEAGGIEAHTLTHPEQLFEMLELVRPDVLVLDINLPGCSGLELARAVRLSDQWLQIPSSICPLSTRWNWKR
jgi:hypothetical protein